MSDAILSIRSIPPTKRGTPRWGPPYLMRRAPLRRDRELAGVDIAGRMHLEALLELVHEGPPLLDFERAFRLGQQLVELGIGEIRFVPRAAGAVGQAVGHDAERTMCPGGE